MTGTIHYLPVTTLGVSRTQRATYIDDLGQKVTVAMTGPGGAQIVFLGTDPVATNAFELSLTGTTSASNLTVSVAGGGQTTVQSVIINGSLNTLQGKSLNVQGQVTASGTINTLNVGYLAAATVTLGGTTASRPVSINALRAVDTSITSGAPIRTLTAGAYINTVPTVPDLITAPSVGTLRVGGTFGGQVVTTGAVKVVQIAGLFSGSIQAAGGIGSVVAGSLDGATLSTGGGIQPALLTAASVANTAGIGRVQVRSTFSGLDHLRVQHRPGHPRVGAEHLGQRHAVRHHREPHRRRADVARHDRTRREPRRPQVDVHLRRLRGRRRLTRRVRPPSLRADYSRND